MGTSSSIGSATEHKPVNSIIQAHADTLVKKASMARTAVSVTAVTWLTNADNAIATACEANSSVTLK